jgi:DNA-binding NtrC family response regulator
MSGKILIVDDEPGMRGLLTRVMEKEGFSAAAAGGGDEALELIDSDEWHLVIADIDMPGMDGIELLKRIRGRKEALPVIMITAYATVESAVEAMKLGAFDYVTKPFQMDELKIVVGKVFEHERLVSEKKMLLDELRGRYDVEGMVGVSRKMRDVIDLALSVAPSRASVLIEGESGTGKELVARAIHDNSDRRDRPFVVVNCGALADGVLESELFGHERGAFSGAVASRKGRFELADGGTLFIDEIGELNPSAQVKLLRFLQEHEFERVGGTRVLKSDARIVVATNRGLKEMVREGNFREDLFYRLNVVHIRIPPLRERTLRS